MKSYRFVRAGMLLLLAVLSFSLASCARHGEDISACLSRGQSENNAPVILREFNIPLRVSASVVVSIPNAEAFKLVAVDLHKWFPGLEPFEYFETSDDGETFVDGSYRVGRYKGDLMVETIRRWHAPDYYVYQIDLDKSEAFIPIRNHIGVFCIEPLSDTQTKLYWQQFFDPVIPGTGPIVSWVMQGIADNAFEKFAEITISH